MPFVPPPSSQSSARQLPAHSQSSSSKSSLPSPQPSHLAHFAERRSLLRHGPSSTGQNLDPFDAISRTSGSIGGHIPHSGREPPCPGSMTNLHATPRPVQLRA